MAIKNKLKFLYNLSTDFTGPPFPLPKITLKILLASMMHTWSRNTFLRCHLIFKKLKVSKILVFHSYSKVIQANTFCILSFSLFSFKNIPSISSNNRGPGEGTSKAPHSQLQPHLQPVPEPSENRSGLEEIPFGRKYALGTSTPVLKGAMITSPYCESRCFLYLPFYPNTCWSPAWM